MSEYEMEWLMFEEERRAEEEILRAMEHEYEVVRALDAVREKCGDGTVSVLASALGPRFTNDGGSGKDD